MTEEVTTGGKPRHMIATAVAALLTLALTSGCVAASSGGTLTDSAGNQLPSEAPGATTPAKPLPKPEVFHGHGDDVLKVHVPGGGAGILFAKTTGTDNFEVLAHGTGSDDAGQGALLVNTLGSYTGTTPVDFGDSKTTSLEIKADGPWTLRLSDALAAKRFAKSVRGRGDNVLVYTGSSGVATVANVDRQGGNYSVMTYARDDLGGFGNLLVNELGSFHGREPWPGGPLFVVINSSGAWSIKAAS